MNLMIDMKKADFKVLIFLLMLSFCYIFQFTVTFITYYFIFGDRYSDEAYIVACCLLNIVLYLLIFRIGKKFSPINVLLAVVACVIYCSLKWYFFLTFSICLNTYIVAF
jgi:hypothetical protein